MKKYKKEEKQCQASSNHSKMHQHLPKAVEPVTQAEHMPCNLEVVGSIPVRHSSFVPYHICSLMENSIK